MRFKRKLTATTGLLLCLSTAMALSGCGNDSGSGGAATNPNGGSGGGGQPGTISPWSLDLTEGCGTVAPGTCHERNFIVDSAGGFRSDTTVDGRVSDEELETLNAALRPIIDDGDQFGDADCSSVPNPPIVGGGKSEVSVAVSDPNNAGSLGSYQIVYLRQANGQICNARDSGTASAAVYNQMLQLLNKYEPMP